MIILANQLRGKKLLEHLNEFHDRGVILDVYPQGEIVEILTEQGSFYFYNSISIDSNGLRIKGDMPRYGLVQCGSER